MPFAPCSMCCWTEMRWPCRGLHPFGNVAARGAWSRLRCSRWAWLASEVLAGVGALERERDTGAVDAERLGRGLGGALETLPLLVDGDRDRRHGLRRRAVLDRRDPVL